ncbi:hypothetical protein Hanom_Chr03g00196161 [Helianthus anomalus]
MGLGFDGHQARVKAWFGLRLAFRLSRFGSFGSQLTIVRVFCSSRFGFESTRSTSSSRLGQQSNSVKPGQCQV